MRIEDGPLYRDPLARHPPGRDLVPVREARPPVAVGPVEDRTHEGAAGEGDELPPFDVRHMSPRRMAEVSMDLYMSGALGWEEYAMLAFQPELHPDYDNTVGALTGEKAEPDRPKDFVAQWEERLAFERKHNAEDEPAVQRTRRIVAVLRRLDQPTDLLV